MLRKTYGNYYIAELVEAQNESLKCVVVEVGYCLTRSIQFSVNVKRLDLSVQQLMSIWILWMKHTIWKFSTVSANPMREMLLNRRTTETQWTFQQNQVGVCRLFSPRLLPTQMDNDPNECVDGHFHFNYWCTCKQWTENLLTVFRLAVTMSPNKAKTAALCFRGFSTIIHRVNNFVDCNCVKKWLKTEVPCLFSIYHTSKN